MHNGRQTQTDQVDELSVEDQIDEICDRFEQQWPDSRLQLLDQLETCTPNLRDRLFVELLLVDWELRCQQEEAPQWNDYFSQFPAFAEQIEAAAFKVSTDAPALAAQELGDGRRRRVGRFELLEKLGTGAAGEVWKAHDPRLHRAVAIKLPGASHLTDNEIDRFLREGRAAAQLDHPHIVPVYEVERNGDTVFIVSAYIAGEDLRLWLKQRRPSYNQAAEICRQLADALHHAHEKDIVHRDLKPGNVIIDSHERVHVTDFGLAKWAQDSRDMTLDGQVLGTPAYMSPEQARGHAAKADRRTDVYSLGVLLYEMLTGQCPFAGDTAAIAYQVIHQEPRRPRSLVAAVPRDLETICLKAMSKSPEDRYPSAQEMEVDLRRFQRGEPILARRAGVLDRSWRWLRRRPAVAMALVFALTAATALAAVGHLAQENHALLGLRQVTLATEPPGAQVVFVPLDMATGEPIAQRAVRPSGVTPIETELSPGDYLVVAVLLDSTGDLRFHEVYRRVPRDSAGMPFVYSHRSWELQADGSIVMPKIVIPASNVVADMALIGGGPSSAQQSAAAPSEKPTSPFYLDCHEVTVEDYSRTLHQLPTDNRWQPVPLDHAVAVTYDRAVSLAEWLGKRLPTEAEFESAMTYRREAPARDDEDSSTTDAGTLGPVGSPSFDRTNTVPPISGLWSNVAEWTSSSVSYRWKVRAGEAPDSFVTADYRVVCGGIPLAEPSLPRRFNRHTLRPDVGFRCARSAHPPFFAPATENRARP